MSALHNYSGPRRSDSALFPQRIYSHRTDRPDSRCQRRRRPSDQHRPRQPMGKNQGIRMFLVGLCLVSETTL